MGVEIEIEIYLIFAHICQGSMRQHTIMNYLNAISFRHQMIHSITLLVYKTILH